MDVVLERSMGDWITGLLAWMEEDGLVEVAAGWLEGDGVQFSHSAEWDDSPRFQLTDAGRAYMARHGVEPHESPSQVLVQMSTLYADDPESRIRVTLHETEARLSEANATLAALRAELRQRRREARRG